MHEYIAFVGNVRRDEKGWRRSLLYQRAMLEEIHNGWHDMLSWWWRAVYLFSQSERRD
jgi:hypothetical protein